VQGSGTLAAQGVTTTSGVPGGRLRTQTGDVLILTGTLTNNALVDLAGGELDVRREINNNADIDARNGAVLRIAGGTGLDNNSGAQLAITGGSVDVFGIVDNNAGAEIAVVGGSTAVFHDAVANSGTIFVSASSEIALLENLAFTPSAALNIALGSQSFGTQSINTLGTVDVGGAATLAGALAVSLGSGFAPAAGDSYEILHAAGGRTGTFGAESLPALSGGLAFDIQYTPTSVILAVISALAGDFDNSGRVDGSDFLAWQRGQSPSPLSASDLAAWKSNYGATATAAVAAVPEPAALPLLALLSLALAVKKRAGSSRAVE
jgi:hypothetical protein